MDNVRPDPLGSKQESAKISKAGGAVSTDIATQVNQEGTIGNASGANVSPASVPSAPKVSTLGAPTAGSLAAAEGLPRTNDDRELLVDRQSDEDALWSEVKGVATHPFLDARSFWLQRQRLLKDPAVSLSRDPRVMPTKPIAFGVQSLLIPTLVTTALLWLLTAVFGLRAAHETSATTLYEARVAADKAATLRLDSLGRVLVRLTADSTSAAEYVAKATWLKWGASVGDDPQMRPGYIGLDMARIRFDSASLSEALGQERWPRAFLRTVIIAAPLKIFFVPILLLLPATLFRRQLARHVAEFPAMRSADRVYLYYGTARAFWAASFIALATFVVTLSGRLGWFPPDIAVALDVAVILVGCLWIVLLAPGTMYGMCTAFASPQARVTAARPPSRLVNWALVRTGLWMSAISGVTYLVILIGFLVVGG